MDRMLQVLLLSLATVVAAEDTLCYWMGPRGGVVRDALYLEGGLQCFGTWQNGAWLNHSLNPHKLNTYGTLFKYNFSTPFDIRTTDLTTLFEPLNETFDATAPIYVGGSMFVDYNEFYTYGGLALSGVPSGAHAGDAGVVNYGLYQPLSSATQWPPGVNAVYNVTDDISLYVAGGAGASAPSESLSFYFSGLKSFNDSPISTLSGGSSSSNFPGTQVDTMLQVDTSSFENAKWTELTLPENVVPRAEASMAWIPVGTKGALIVVGGVVDPADLNNFLLNSTQQTISVNQSPSFMTNIPVYDIANAKWYVQETSGTPPPQLAQSCIVPASAKDGSSHNLYLYGGYDGLGKAEASDAVWILSLPTFTWVQASSGNVTHGRYSHICAKPYPNIMLSVGGVAKANFPLEEPYIIDAFDLNTLTWTGKYDPKVWEEYKVPSTVVSAIGAKPSMDVGLENLFNTAYAGNIRVWYPYTSNAVHHSSKTTIIIIIVVVVVLLAIIAGCLWYFCRPAARKRRHDAAAAAAASEKTGSGSKWFMTKWFSGTPRPDTVPDKSVVSSVTEIGDNPRSPPGVHEAWGDSYFKARARGDATQVSSPGLTTPGSRTHFPARSPLSPASNDSSEIDGRHVQELDNHERSGLTRGIMSIHNHPLYPHNLGNRTASQRSTTAISSPSHQNHAQNLSPSEHDRMSPYELPHKRSNEDVLPQLDEEFVLAQPPPPIEETPKTPPLPTNTAYMIDAGAPGTYTPQTHMSPTLLPSALVTDVGELHEGHNIHSIEQNHHQRQKSSIDSGLTQYTYPSPGEDQRRSQHLRSLPDHPGLDGAESSTQRRTETMQIIQESSSAYEENEKLQQYSKAVSASAALQGLGVTTAALKRKPLAGTHDNGATV